MSEFVHDCPRCGATRITFDVRGQCSRGIVHAGWVERFEVFCVCRACRSATIFVLDNIDSKVASVWKTNGIVDNNTVINRYFNYVEFINISDINHKSAPDHVDEKISEIYTEASRCLSIGCWNAAGAMYRLCIDLSTKSLLPSEQEHPNMRNSISAKTRRSLGLRLEWMFNNEVLPKELADLADCIQQDGNDGAHDGTLTEADALDLSDFAYQLLDRIYTQPKRIEIAKKRREERRSPSLD